MDLEKDLDVLLITYNRKNKLKNMLARIFSEDSPIKKCSITFLDNCSTDGTSELLAEYAHNYSNVQHVRHKYNIGGNANIMRAFETVNTSKKYFWILCDDDYLDWTRWDKIDKALKSDQFDVIQVHFDEMVPVGCSLEDRIAKSIVELVLVPAAIYRVKYITSDMLFLGYVNIYAMIPHMSLIASAVNSEARFYHCDVTEQILVKRHDTAEFRRGIADTLSHTALRMDLPVGFAVSLSMLKNQIIKKQAVNLSRSYLGWNFSGYIRDSLYGWIHNCYNDDLMAVYSACDDDQKRQIYEMMHQIQYYRSKLPNITPDIYIHAQSIGIKRSIKQIIGGMLSLMLSLMKWLRRHIPHHHGGRGYVNYHFPLAVGEVGLVCFG